MQGVKWIVMNDITLIGSSQLDAFRTAMGSHRMVRQEISKSPEMRLDAILKCVWEWLAEGPPSRVSYSNYAGPPGMWVAGWLYVILSDLKSLSLGGGRTTSTAMPEVDVWLTCVGEQRTKS